MWVTPLNLDNGWETGSCSPGLYSYHISQLFSPAWANENAH